MCEKSRCRICLDEWTDHKSRYCKCSGPVHQECLKRWIEYRAVLYHHPHWNKCELCGEEYAIDVMVNRSFILDMVREVITFIAIIFWTAILISLCLKENIDLMIIVIVLVGASLIYVFYLRILYIESHNYPEVRDLYEWKVLDRSLYWVIPRNECKSKLLIILSR